MAKFEGPYQDSDPSKVESEPRMARDVIKTEFKHLEERVLKAMEAKRVDGVSGEKAARRELASALRMNHPGKFENVADRIERGIGSIQW
jgi:hypothetical protein